MSNTEVKTPWSLTIDDILSKLNVSAEKGISKKEIKKRRDEYGKNLLKESQKKSVWEILLAQFKSLIVIVLLTVVVISFLFSQTIEGFAILAVVIINGAIGFITEFKAEKSMESLKQLTQVKSSVKRNGKIKKLNAELILPGDIVILEGGDVVSADIRLIEANKLQADESTLTGESLPVSKTIDKIETETELAERTNMVFKGTAITKSSGKGIVVSIGMNTELGNISSLVEEAEEEITPLEKKLDSLGKKLIWLTFGLAIAVGVIGYLRGKELLLMIETAVALAIAAIPEGLPIVATVALARGMLVMAKKNTLINKLSSVETLGATNILCVDKTGTLTENQMTVKQIALNEKDYEISGEGFDTDGDFSFDGNKIDPTENDLLFESLKIGVLCNNATIPEEDEDSIGDPLEVALLVAGAKAGIKRKDLLNDMPEEKEVAFDTDKMMMATFNKIDDKYFVAIKGAPEPVIKNCTQIKIKDSINEFDESNKEKWIDKNEKLAGEGLRVLALASKEASSTDEDPYENMNYVGLVGLYDPPRQGVSEAISECKEAGINLIMVTGDHPSTAQQIAKSINLISDEENSFTYGKDLEETENYNDDKLNELAKQKVFARVTPEQKLNLISLHQKRESIVAMTGDGVNDAPALKKADIGIAMGQRGTQVAKDASDMILKDDALSSVVSAVEQGRTIFKNIRKFVLYLLSGNMGEILAVAATFITIAVLPLYPLQILFLNFGIDVFPALAVGMGASEKGIMNHAPRDSKEPILNKRGWLFIWLFGIIIAASIVTSFKLAQSWLGYSREEAVTVAFLTLGFSRLWHVFNMRSTNSNLFINEISKNKFIWIAFAICFVLLFSALYVPFISQILNTHQPDIDGWILVFTASLIPLFIGQLLKFFKVELQ